MSRLIFSIIWIGLLAGAPAFAKDPLGGLPGPVASYAKQFDQDCKSNGWGNLILSDNYSQPADSSSDVNGDRVSDYFVYKCMFGCSDKPSAFTGLGTPCAWGSLLLSGNGSHRNVFLPGMVTQVHTGTALRIVLTRPRALRSLGNYCKEPFPETDVQHVYELKDGRFQLNGVCPAAGCKTLFSQAGEIVSP